MRPLFRTVLAIIAAVLLPLVFAAPAQADSYRYWGYYQWSDGAWQFAMAGPAETVPDDGAVEGWRYAVAETESPRMPRTGDVFEEICGDSEADEGQKRVAVVIDHGTADDAPDGDEPPQARGECAVVADDATGADILAAVAEVRIGDDGLTCGIDGYPSTDCGGPVDGAAPQDDEETVDLAVPDDADGEEAPTLALLGGVAVVVIIGVAALVRIRRSRSE